MKIAYQGEPGAFSEAASRLGQRGRDARAVQELRGCVRRRRAGTGVMRRAADRELDRRQHSPQLRPADRKPPADRRRGRSAGRASPAGAAGRDARRRSSAIYSHPQALAQCERFLRTLTGVEIVATYDTAGSAKMVADGKLTDTAAIASARGRRDLRPRAARRRRFRTSATTSRASSSSAGGR